MTGLLSQRDVDIVLFADFERLSPCAAKLKRAVWRVSIELLVLWAAGVHGAEPARIDDRLCFVVSIVLASGVSTAKLASCRHV